MKATRRERPRRGQGEPRRRLARQQVAGLQPHELGRARARRAGEDRPLRAHLGQRRPGPRPARLDAPGLRRRHDVDHARHPFRRVVLRPLPDEDLRLRQRHRLQVLPARHHGQPRRRDHPARRAAALDRAGEPAARARDAQSGRQRPARRLQRQGRRRLDRPARAALRRQAHGQEPRLLLQQGLRRRRGGDPVDAALVRHLSGLRARRPRLPEHERGGRPGLHRRHLPQRPARRRPARRRAEPARPGRLQDALHQPVERQALADRRGRRRQDGRPHPRRLRQPARHARLRRLDRRHRPRPGRPRSFERAPVGLGDHHPRHELQRRLLARQQHPRDRGPARLQLLDAGHQREHVELALRLPARQQRGQPAR